MIDPGPEVTFHGAPMNSLETAVRIRLAALWTSAMFIYVYGDLIGFYVPGRIDAVARGDMGPLGVANDAILVGIAATMAIPSVMIALSLHLRAKANRFANVVLGSIYSLMMIATMFSAPPYYLLLGCIVVALTGSIVCVAWRSPGLCTAGHIP
jgi:hypothetical protein